jgi:hypothetical protein
MYEVFGSHSSPDPLKVEFPEALDHALATRVLAVKDPVEGTTTVDREETRWRFSPSTSWRKGTYEISVPGILEDLRCTRPSMSTRR